MAKLLTSCILDKVPTSYVQPPEKRAAHSRKLDTPIIDLYDEKTSTFHIMKASQDLGLFQLVNHGVPTQLMQNAMEVFEEVFNMSSEEKEKINMEEDKKEVCRIYTSTYNYNNEAIHCWRDVLRVHCNPLDECIKFWPQSPQRFKSIIGAYVKALEELGLKILESISEGLGLERGYFVGKLSEENLMLVNHYPSCPNPSLTLGAFKHTDPTIITILQSGHVPGLQLFKDGEWLDVETPPNSFVVLMGSQIEVVSNGKLKGAVHRVTSNAQARTSIAFDIYPTMDCLVGPAKALTDGHNSIPLYKTYLFKDFFQTLSKPKSKGQDINDVTESLKIKP